MLLFAHVILLPVFVHILSDAFPHHDLEPQEASHSMNFDEDDYDYSYIDSEKSEKECTQISSQSRPVTHHTDCETEEENPEILSIQTERARLRELLNKAISVIGHLVEQIYTDPGNINCDYESELNYLKDFLTAFNIKTYPHNFDFYKNEVNHATVEESSYNSAVNNYPFDTYFGYNDDKYSESQSQSQGSDKEERNKELEIEKLVETSELSNLNQSDVKEYLGVTEDETSSNNQISSNISELYNKERLEEKEIEEISNITEADKSFTEQVGLIQSGLQSDNKEKGTGINNSVQYEDEDNFFQNSETLIKSENETLPKKMRDENTADQISAYLTSEKRTDRDVIVSNQMKEVKKSEDIEFASTLEELSKDTNNAIKEETHSKDVHSLEEHHQEHELNINTHLGKMIPTEFVEREDSKVSKEESILNLGEGNKQVNESLKNVTTEKVNATEEVVKSVNEYTGNTSQTFGHQGKSTTDTSLTGTAKLNSNLGYLNTRDKSVIDGKSEKESSEFTHLTSASTNDQFQGITQKPNISGHTLFRYNNPATNDSNVNYSENVGKVTSGQQFGSEKVSSTHLKKTEENLDLDVSIISSEFVEVNQTNTADEGGNYFNFKNKINGSNTKPLKKKPLVTVQNTVGNNKTYDTILEYLYDHTNSSLLLYLREKSKNVKPQHSK